MSSLEYFAFKYSTFAENWGYNFLIIALAALVFGYLKKVDDRMQRATYFLNSTLIIFFTSICQAIWLLSIDAIAGGYFFVLVALDIAVWFTAGYWSMIIAKARSNDAYGHSRYAVLGFIPIANLWLLFTPSKEKHALPTPAYFGGVTAVMIGLVVSGASRGITLNLERTIQDEIARVAQSDQSHDLNAIYFGYHVKDAGLTAGLKYLASLETLGALPNGETSLDRVDVSENAIIYRNRILDDTVMSTNPQWAANLRQFFCTNYAFVFEAGGKIQVDMFTNRSGTITMITADQDNCKA